MKIMRHTLLDKIKVIPRFWDINIPVIQNFSLHLKWRFEGEYGFRSLARSLSWIVLRMQLFP